MLINDVDIHRCPHILTIEIVVLITEIGHMYSSYILLVTEIGHINLSYTYTDH